MIVRDSVALMVLLVLFAAWTTIHVAIVSGIVSRQGWARGLVSFAVPVLAPIWGARAGMRARAVTWAALFVAYVAARVVAR
jgi:hypothetical protein